jgi:hypothetical protein
MPSPGGQISGMADTSAKPGAVGVAGCGVPPTSSRGYHAAPRGHAWQARPAVGTNGAPGAPRGRAMPGRRDAPRLPACKISASVTSTPPIQLKSAGREESRPSPPGTGRAKSVPDTAVTPGVQWGATGTADCHSPANTPTYHRRSGTVSAGVAGQGFEPWKACADGFTTRTHCAPDLGKSARCVFCRHTFGTGT